jgi:hypothetical protein
MVRLDEICFGIELETTQATRQRVAEAICSVVGGEVVYIGHPAVYDPWEVRDDQGRVWRVVADSSLQSAPPERRAEIVSPILTAADLPTLQAVVRAVRRTGAIAGPDAGIHVHLSHPSVTPKALANLAKLVYKQEPIIYAALGVSPDRMARFCKPINPEFIKRITKTPPRSFAKLNTQWYGKFNPSPQRYDKSRYHVLNFNAYFLRGAVELRAFSGSLHAGRIKAVIFFSLALFARALNAHGASAKKRIYNPATAKFDFRVFLISALKLNGPTFKTTRQHLLALMPGDSAFKYGKAQRPKRNPKKTTEETPGAGAEMLRPSC